MLIWFANALDRQLVPLYAKPGCEEATTVGLLVPLLARAVRANPVNKIGDPGRALNTPVCDTIAGVLPFRLSKRPAVE
jgi:hypothetical protein